MVGYSQNKGGVETYISNLSNNLNKAEFNIVYSMPEMEINGKTWHRPTNRHNYIKYFSFWMKFFVQNKFDVIYYNTCDIVSIDLLKFAKWSNIPVRIIHSHNSANQMQMNIIHKFQEYTNKKYLINKYATDFLACSEVAGKWMFGNRPFTVIKNGIKTSLYKFSSNTRNKTRSKYNIKMDEFVLCFIGRFENQKNPIKTIRIFDELTKKQEKDVKLLLVGAGSLENELKKSVEDLNLEEQVIFAGTTNDIPSVLSASDCLIMTSEFEGLPFVLVEAQASGLPCVVSENVSKEAKLSDLIQFIPNSKSNTFWADIILNINIDNNKRSAYTDIVKNKGYDIQSSAKIVEDIIEKALNKNEKITENICK